MVAVGNCLPLRSSQIWRRSSTTTAATEALATVTAAEEDSEAEGDVVSGEVAAAATDSGAVGASAPAEEYTNATSAKLLITEAATWGLIRLSLTGLAVFFIG